MVLRYIFIYSYKFRCSSLKNCKYLFRMSAELEMNSQILEARKQIGAIKKKLFGIIGEIENIESNLLKIETKTSFTKLIARNFSTSSTSKRKFVDEHFSDTDGNPSKTLKADFIRDENGYVQVYTDGACENNGKPNAKAGFGVWFSENHPLNISEPVSGRATNNCGEIQACTAAINAAKKAGVDKLRIYSDSQFVINSITKWIHNWKRKGWKTADGKPVKNKEDFVLLDEAMKFIDVKFEHVPGHSNIEGNEAADKLARMGAERYVLK